MATAASVTADSDSAGIELPKPSSVNLRVRIVPGELLVKFKAGVPASVRAQTLSGTSLRAKQSFYSVPGLQLVATAGLTDTTAAAAALSRDSGVEYVEPNYRYSADAIPNDPEFPRQRGLNNTGQFHEVPPTYFPDINAPEAWDVTSGSGNVVVAVIDSGIDYTHEDLAANMYRNEVECTPNGIDDDGNGYIDDCYGIDTVNHDSDPMDDAFHGTHVAGIIGAVGNNAVGIAGVAWNVRLVACKFLAADGWGTTAGAIECLDYVAALRQRGVNVVATNNSWSGGGESRALGEAIGRQRAAGILFVAAAGNDATDMDLLPSFPCAYDRSNVICVGSAYDQLIRYSNYGVATVHLGAPGDSILSTIPGNAYEMHDGTSMAAPHVTGAVVLLNAQSPGRDWRALKNLVLTGTYPPTFGPRMTVSNGSLDVAKSLSCTNGTVLARLRPTLLEDIARPVGAAIVLKALHIRCALPDGAVTVTVAPTAETVTLQDDGQGDDESAGDGVYSGRWITPAPGDYTLIFGTPTADQLPVHVDSQLRPGFPAAVETYYEGFSARVLSDSLVVGNIAGDDHLEILATSVDYGPLNAWHDDGSAVMGWPNYDVPNAGRLSLGEFDGTSTTLEVAAMHFFDGMRLYRGNGIQMPGWPQPWSVVVWGHAPATADLDGDRIDELLTLPVRRVDGSKYQSNPPFPATGSGTASTVALADLDADGEPEVVTADNHELWASNRHGPLPGFPVELAGDRTWPPQYPVVGDVTGDGKPDIVLASLIYDGAHSNERVEIYAGDGKLEQAWGFIGDFATVMPSLADLTGDGVPEIVMQDGLHAFAWFGNGQPLPGWPVQLDQTFNYGAQPVVGDLNGDGQPDVVLLRGPKADGRGVVHALNSQAAELPGYPKVLWSMAGATTPAIADLDHNGRNELVVAAVPDIGRRDGVFVYGNSAPGVDGPIEWEQFMEGASRHGYYQLGKNLPNHAFLAVQTHGAGSVSSDDGLINCGTDCVQKYAKGTGVVLRATATAPGARFARWVGACNGQGNPCRLNIGAYTAGAADFDTPLSVSTAGSGSGVVVSDVAGIACPGQCVHVFAARTKVTLTATAATNNGFGHWEGACSGTAPTCTVILDDAKSVTAHFIDRQILSVARAGVGHGTITSADGAINCGSVCSAGFIPGSTVRLLAAPAPDSYVESWSLDGCHYSTESCDVTLDAPRTVTVNFALKPVLNVGKTGPGTGRVVSTPAGIDCGATCSAPMPLSALVEVRAIPDPDSYVVGWQGCSGGFGSTCTFFMHAPQDIVVQLELKPTLTITIDGTGVGQVMESTAYWTCEASCSQRLDPTQPHMLIAAVGPGSVFAGWSGACAGTSGNCALSMTGDVAVTATFNATGGSGGGTGGGPSGGGGGGGSGGGGGRTSYPELLMLLGLAALRGRIARGRDGFVPL